MFILFGINKTGKNGKLERNWSKFGLRSSKLVQFQCGRPARIIFQNPRPDQIKKILGFFPVLLRISDNQGSGKPGFPVFTTGPDGRWPGRPASTDGKDRRIDETDGTNAAHGSIRFLPYGCRFQFRWFPYCWASRENYKQFRYCLGID